MNATQMNQPGSIEEDEFAGDIGDAPTDLLDPVFNQCSPQQLTAIEDETR